MPDAPYNPTASDPPDPRATETFTRETVPHSPRLPDRIGRYHIKHVIGEGGMGTVYEATQDNPRRVVALKVIRPGYASPQMLKRFDQESQVLGRLQHPGIAQIYEAGTHEVSPGAAGKHGAIVPYFAMEFIRGRGLKEFMEEAKLGTRQRLELVAKICDTVHHAHQKGVIHRDLKPGNILVDESGQPKILDFGVARATDSDIQAATIQTDVGQLIGTIPYMSPEQVAADPQELDTRSDVYALGVIAYEALAGRLPYDLKHKMIHEAARVIREEEPAPLSTVNRLFRGDVETIVAKSLEKDKTRRYQSAAELASDIRRYLHDEPIVARPASAAYQLRKFAKRNKPVVVGVAAVFLVLVAGIIVSTTLYLRAEASTVAEAAQRRRAQVNEIKAQHEAETARKERDKAKITSEFMSDILKGAGPSVAIGRDATMLREMLDGAAKRIRDGELTNAPEAEVQLRGTIGMTYNELGVYDQAREMIEPTMEQARRLYGEEHAEVATSLHNFAVYLNSQDKESEAERLEREALAMRRKLLGEVHPDVAESLYNLSGAICDQSRYSEAEPLQREALAMRRKLYGDEHPEVAKSLSNLAAFLQTYGKYPEAEQLQREALAMQRKILGEDHPDVVISLDYLATDLQNQGKYPEAEPVRREMLAMSRKLFGQEHPSVANSLYRLANNFLNQGNDAEAERLYREALAMRRKLLGDEHPSVANNLNGLALVLQSQGKYPEAEQMLRESLAMTRKLQGEENPSVATSLSNLGSVLNHQGKYPEAEQVLREALAMRRKLLGEEHPDVAHCLNHLARALERLGNFEEVEAMARESLRICEAKLPADHNGRIIATSLLGAALSGRHQFAEAEPLLLAAQEALKDRAGVTSIRKRELVEYIVKLYDAWDAAERGNGYAEKAAEWRAKLDASNNETQKRENAESSKP